MKDNNLNNIKTSGFKVPKDYFEGLEDAILNEIHLKAQVKDTGFKVPNNYFDTVETSILSKLEKPEVKVIPLFSRKTILTLSSIAAAVVLFFSLNLFKTNLSIDSLDTDTVENYILDEIELNDLSVLIEDSELSQTDFINYKTLEIKDFIDDIDLNELYQD